MKEQKRKQLSHSAQMYKRALVDALRKFHPRKMVRNPVMFVVEVVSVLTTVFWVQALMGQGEAPASFIGNISLWLWFTVFFANFAEALAEGRGKAQAEALRRMRKQTQAKRLSRGYSIDGKTKPENADYSPVASTDLRKGDLYVVEAGDTIPADGEIAEGIASVDESAVTGESAPVIRESGGDRSAVTGGTRVLSDWLIVRVSIDPGEGFLDRMIALVEGAKRQKTPNEIALDILLAGFAIIFLVVCATLLPFSLYSVKVAGKGVPVTITVLVALLVCLIPTTIGGLLSAIGIAGMDRLIRRNVIAMSGRAVEAAGDVDVLLLDKTGTITLGNRQAVELVPIGNVGINELAEITQLASLADETPEGRSIMVLVKEKYGLRGRTLGPAEGPGMQFIPFSAQTRMSGVDINGTKIRKGAVNGTKIRKGAADVIVAEAESSGQKVPRELQDVVNRIAQSGGTPLVVSKNGQAVGVVHLKDVVKGGIRERFAQLKRMGIRTVMITGDNPVTAAAIAAEAGVDDFLAQATPEAKLKLIRQHQAGGRLVAMTGDGTNDAPALAQADVAVAMNTGT
ncbi:MAG: potassium-transporting ATPase subunit KdpB, partial [Deltaproteobacteria bacterium]|nr:potassium-transporting ATPase subunit KdpB [Deltaproteobacteria bacterium]